MTFTEKDFKRCRFNPFDPELLEKAAVLVLLIGGDIKKVKYIIAMYDPNSPLIKAIPELDARKIKAAEVAGIEVNEGVRKEMFEFLDDAFAEMVDKYLREYVNSRLWAMIISTEETFWEFNARLRKPVTGQVLGKEKDELQAVDIKTKLRQSMDEMNAALDGYYSKFYMQDQQLETVVKRKRFTPESFANKDK